MRRALLLFVAGLSLEAWPCREPTPVSHFLTRSGSLPANARGVLYLVEAGGGPSTPTFTVSDVTTGKPLKSKVVPLAWFKARTGDVLFRVEPAGGFKAGHRYRFEVAGALAHPPTPFDALAVKHSMAEVDIAQTPVDLARLELRIVSEARSVLHVPKSECASPAGHFDTERLSVAGNGDLFIAPKWSVKGEDLFSCARAPTCTVAARCQPGAKPVRVEVDLAWRAPEVDDEVRWAEQFVSTLDPSAATCAE